MQITIPKPVPLKHLMHPNPPHNQRLYSDHPKTTPPNSLPPTLSTPTLKWTIPSPLLLQMFPPPPPPPHPPPSPPNYLTNLGLGYSIAISLGFLVLLSSLLLSSYVCCRRRRRSLRYDHSAPLPTTSVTTDGGVILPRIIFLSEDDSADPNDPAVVGLDSRVINSYPKFPFVRATGSNNTCSICLCEYREAEMLRMMPECRHTFHLCCLDAWLKLNGSCPVCRNSPLPTPLSTPLQEVVPLSQYADNRGRRR